VTGYWSWGKETFVSLPRGPPNKKHDTNLNGVICYRDNDETSIYIYDARSPRTEVHGAQWSRILVASLPMDVMPLSCLLMTTVLPNSHVVNTYFLNNR
jgi:hypothetical protein